MQKSKELTTLAVLRVKYLHKPVPIGKPNKAGERKEKSRKITQKELAELLHVDREQVRNTERGLIDLDEGLGESVSYLTDVNIDWLLDGDITQPAIDRYGHRYTPETFLKRQAELKPGELNRGQAGAGDFAHTVQFDFALNISKLSLILRSALKKRGRAYDLAAYKLKVALNQLVFETWGDQPTPSVMHDALNGKHSASWPDLSLVRKTWREDMKTIFPKDESLKTGPPEPKAKKKQVARR